MKRAADHRPGISIAEEFRRYKESTEAKMEAMRKRQDGEPKGKEQGEGVASDGLTLVSPEVFPKLSRAFSRRKTPHSQRSAVRGASNSGALSLTGTQPAAEDDGKVLVEGVSELNSPSTTKGVNHEQHSDPTSAHILGTSTYSGSQVLGWDGDSLCTLQQRVNELRSNALECATVANTAAELAALAVVESKRAMASADDIVIHLRSMQGHGFTLQARNQNKVNEHGAARPLEPFEMALGQAAANTPTSASFVSMDGMEQWCKVAFQKGRNPPISKEGWKWLLDVDYIEKEVKAEEQSKEGQEGDKSASMARCDPHEDPEKLTLQPIEPLDFDFWSLREAFRIHGMVKATCKALSILLTLGGYPLSFGFEPPNPRVTNSRFEIPWVTNSF